MRHASEKRTAAETVAVERANIAELIRDHEAGERKQERITALEQEREAQQAKLAHARAIGPDGKHRLEIGNSSGWYFVDRSGSQLRAEAEASIAAINTEIERVERDGVPDPRAPVAEKPIVRFPDLELR
jgi:hypothetical protein